MKLLGALGIALCTFAGAASAEPREPLELDWHAPPECPERASVYDRIRALAGATPQQEGRLRAEAVVTRLGDRFKLRLVLRSGNLVGERSLESDSCDALAGAAAVALVLLLSSPEPLGQRELSGAPPAATDGAETGERTQPAPPASAPKPAPPRVTRAAAEHEREQRDSSESAPWLRVLVQAPVVTLDLDPPPRPNGGVGAALGLRVEGFHVLLGVQVMLPQSLSSEVFAGYGARIWRAAAEAWLCHGWRSDRLELAPCALLTLQRITARAESPYVVSSSVDAYWFSGGAGALGRWYALDYLALFVGVGGRIEVPRPQLEITGLGTVERLGPLAVTIRLGTEWIW